MDLLYPLGSVSSDFLETKTGAIQAAVAIGIHLGLTVDKTMKDAKM